jgi:hypothetical protein
MKGKGPRNPIFTRAFFVRRLAIEARRPGASAVWWPDSVAGSRPTTRFCKSKQYQHCSVPDICFASALIPRQLPLRSHQRCDVVESTHTARALFGVTWYRIR